MESDNHAKAMWHVLRRIKSSRISNAKDVQFNLYEYKLGSDNIPAAERQFMALCELRDQGIINFVGENATAGTWEDFIDTRGFTYTEYDLRITNESRLDELYVQYENLMQDLAKQQLVSVAYNPDGGDGRLGNGRQFTLKGVNKEAFNLLYANKNNWVSRGAVLKALRFKHKADSSYGKERFNTYVTNLRKKTGLTKYQLLQRDGRVMLEDE